MRNNDHKVTEAYDYATSNGTAMNAHAGALTLTERSLREAMNGDLAVIAAQLTEAACSARVGDREATTQYIASAVALLHGNQSFEPSVGRGLSKVRDAAAVGNIDDQTNYLRASAVHGLRSVFADRQPRIFSLLENSYHVPITYRALSRRETGVLQMIARGMSNKCIARSLGIAPETVKSHVKHIFSKLKARTRAQAVACAEASACF